MTGRAAAGRSFAWLVSIALLAGCRPHVPFLVSSADQERFAGNLLRVDVAGHDPKIFGVSDCTVYRAQTAHGDIVGWKVVLASDWGSSYPKWATSCTRSSISYDGHYVHVFLCAQAFGAGGGCAGGGSYRSRTGDVQGWQLLDPAGWATLPDYDKATPAPAHAVTHKR